MLAIEQLRGGKIALRNIELSDCNETYLQWLQDSTVSAYLETRWQDQSIEMITEFVNEIRRSNHSILFAIVENDSGQHIGNIKIGPINTHHSYADISYFIGEKSCWGKGYAKEAIALAVDYGFNTLRLHRIQAGVYSGNLGSIKALERVGFIREGCLREKLICNGQREDHYWYGILQHERHIV